MLHGRIRRRDEESRDDGWFYCPACERDMPIELRKVVRYSGVHVLEYCIKHEKIGRRVEVEKFVFTKEESASVRKLRLVK